MIKKTKLTFSFIKIYILLIHFDFSLRLNGFHKMFSIYADKYEITEERSKLHSPDYNEMSWKINELLQLIDTACACYPFEAQCMHRTFLAYKLIRKRFGLPVQIVIGVRKFPFQAHAWLMLDEHNVNESYEFTENLKILLNTRM